MGNTASIQPGSLLIVLCLSIKYDVYLLFIQQRHLHIIIDREAREIMYLAASVLLSVCPSASVRSHS